MNKTENKKVIIKSFDAGAGDSFYLYFPSEKFNFLIDGGYNYTYTAEIKPVLNEIKKRGEILDLLVVTHMCEDHIKGIIKLIKENGSNSESKIVRIGEVWCNTFFNSYENNKKISIPSEVRRRLKSVFPWEYTENYTGDIGVAQLNSLSELLLSGGYLVNSKPIIYNPDLTIKKGNIKFKILSPNKEAIDKLIEKFVQEIPKDIRSLEEFYNYELSEYYDRFLSSIMETSKHYRGDISISDINKLANLEFSEDSSISNKSSLAFTIEYLDKKLIFLGDSVPSIYFKNLREYYPNLMNECFSLVKLSHHGSKENTPIEFFEKINAKNYLISTNGNTHSHPDKETIARMVIGSKQLKNVIINCENQELEEFINFQKLIEKFGFNFIKKKHIEV